MGVVRRSSLQLSQAVWASSYGRVCGDQEDRRGEIEPLAFTFYCPNRVFGNDSQS